MLVFVGVNVFVGVGVRVDVDVLVGVFVSVLVIVGAGLIIWAAIREKTMLKPILWVLGVSLVLFFGCQGLAQVTGLANGSLPASGPVFIIVMVMLILYDLGVVALTILGGMVIKKAFSAEK